MTASTTPTSGAPETSSWDNSTVVAAGAAQKSSKAQKVALATEGKPKTLIATKGKYKIHIAALRSRAEAEALAQQLVAQHGADLSNHVPSVDEAVIGSMGTFYRVRVGGYASQEEPRGVCNKLRSSGLDCLVVTN
jgi:cell division protein FtsN